MKTILVKVSFVVLLLVFLMPHCTFVSGGVKMQQMRRFENVGEDGGIKAAAGRIESGSGGFCLGRVKLQ